MKAYPSLSHTRWDCKYHMVYIPKRRKRRILGQLRRHLGEIFRELAEEQLGLKILANATSYGIFAEFNVDESPHLLWAGRRSLPRTRAERGTPLKTCSLQFEGIVENWAAGSLLASLASMMAISGAFLQVVGGLLPPLSLGLLAPCRTYGERNPCIPSRRIAKPIIVDLWQPVTPHPSPR